MNVAVDNVMRAPSRWWSVLVIIVSCAACAAGASASASPSGGVPALEVTSATGKKSVLIGSIHVGVDGLRQPASSALESARVYVVEKVHSAMASAASSTTSSTPAEGSTPHAPGPSGEWTHNFTPAELHQLEQRIDCSSRVPGLGQLIMSAPVTSTKDLYLFALQPCPPSNVSSRDAVLGRYAAALNKPKESLEVESDVDSMRAEVPEKLYLQLIRYALSGRQQRDLDSTAAALNEGDHEAVMRLVRGTFANEDSAATYEKLMIIRRNEQWMPKLAEIIDDGDAFINVGAAHLGGPQGLIALLRARGYQVQAITLPSH